MFLFTSAPALADYMDHFTLREDIGPHKVPSQGDAQVLLIPVEVAGYPPIDAAALRTFFDPASAGGFSQYYDTASIGRYHPRVTIAPTVHFAKCPISEVDFPNCAVPRADPKSFGAGLTLVHDLLAMTDDAGVDFTAFDTNGRKGMPDGWLDGVMILLNTSFGGVAFPVAYFNHGDNLAGGTGGPLIVDGKKLPHIAVAGNGKHLVLVHEFGHLLGLTDLYDESQKYDGLWLSWMGAWSYDRQIPLPDAESRFRLRWANWHQVQGRERVTLHPAQTTGEVYRLGTGDQYFLVENRGPGDRFDGNLTERGLAVFHVDRAGKLGGAEGEFVARLIDCVNCDPWHPFIRLVQADGAFDIEHGRHFGPGDLFTAGKTLGPAAAGRALSVNTQFNSTNWYDGGVSGISIEDIKVNADGTIEVTLTAPESGQCVERLCDDGPGCAPVTCGTPSTPAVGCGCSESGVLSMGLAVMLGALLLRSRRS